MRRPHKEVHPEELASLAAAIRDRRLKNGLNQTEFAEQVGVSNKTMDNIEAARNWPSVPVYIAICRVLRVGRIPLVRAA